MYPIVILHLSEYSLAGDNLSKCLHYLLFLLTFRWYLVYYVPFSLIKTPIFFIHILLSSIYHNIMNRHDTLLLFLHSTSEGKEILIESEKLHNSFHLKLQVQSQIRKINLNQAIEPQLRNLRIEEYK